MSETVDGIMERIQAFRMTFAMPDLRSVEQAITAFAERAEAAEAEVARMRPVVDAAVRYEAARSALDTDLDDDTTEAGAMFGVLLKNYAAGRDGLIAATESYLADIRRSEDA